MSFRKPTLPPDFAQRLLQSQIQFSLAAQPAPQVLRNLIELYSMGVEYYQAQKSHKYMYFKRKMQQLFRRRAVFGQKEEETQNDSPVRQKMLNGSEEEKIQALKMRDKQQKMQSEVSQLIRVAATKREAQKIMEKVGEKQKILENKIKATLQTQDKALQQKLNQRKTRSFHKSFSQSLGGNTDTKDSLLQSLVGRKIGDSFVQPIPVSFQEIIDLDDDQKNTQVRLKKKSILTKGRMTSMFAFHK